MEIFIVGALVVALMVFVSTKIKKSAARAFVPELIERDEFNIAKPEGFMTPLETGRDGFLFEAYSREYGEKKARNIRCAQAFLNGAKNLNFDAECERAKKSAGKILSERVLENGDGERVFLLESEEKGEDDFPVIVFRKIVESRARGKTYDLKVSVLQSLRDVYIHKVNEMINSFRLK
jgi:hypothetical protein